MAALGVSETRRFSRRGGQRALVALAVAVSSRLQKSGAVSAVFDLFTGDNGGNSSIRQQLVLGFSAGIRFCQPSQSGSLSKCSVFTLDSPARGSTGSSETAAVHMASSKPEVFIRAPRQHCLSIECSKILHAKALRRKE